MSVNLGIQRDSLTSSSVSKQWRGRIGHPIKVHVQIECTWELLGCTNMQRIRKIGRRGSEGAIATLIQIQQKLFTTTMLISCSLKICTQTLHILSEYNFGDHLQKVKQKFWFCTEHWTLAARKILLWDISVHILLYGQDNDFSFKFYAHTSTWSGLSLVTISHTDMRNIHKGLICYNKVTRL